MDRYVLSGQKTRHRAIVYISKLYKVEAEADEAKLTAEQRKEKRVNESYPVILVFEKWMKDMYPTVLPKSRIGQAIEYAFTLLPRLSRYVNDGRISIDNNPVERVKIKSGEKNVKSREKTINRWGEKRIFAFKEKIVCKQNSKNLYLYTENWE